MSWKEIMMSINSDIRTPLNKLIERVLDKLDNISTGGGTGSSGSKPFYTSDFIKTITNPNGVSTLPYSFYQGSAVVYNNEIHILGCNSSNTSHYKWNGTSWTSVSTIPYVFYYGSAVVYNNEIHILGSNSSSYNKYHYKLNNFLYQIYLPSGSIIYFYDNRITSIIGKTNCTKQTDSSFLVNSNGLVELNIINNNTGEIINDIKYTIY